MPRPIHRRFRVQHRYGSRAWRLENALLPLVRTCTGGPTSWATLLTPQLGWRVRRQDIVRILKSRNFTRKLRSLVPGDHTHTLLRVICAVHIYVSMVYDSIRCVCECGNYNLYLHIV